mmetsp:Transcript_606/g.734  ORF Transcript_606/g.734 Transcript_606/m.734 type:complete len:354 (-) Transcript_606:235-1296(-)
MTTEVATTPSVPSLIDSTAFNRVINYPVINYAYETTTSTYNSVKEYNGIVKSALEFGERNVASCTQTVASPVLHVLNSYNVDVDKTGCQMLDKIEDSVQYVSDVSATGLNTILDRVDKNIDYFLPEPTAQETTQEAAKEPETKNTVQRIQHMPQKLAFRMMERVLHSNMAKYASPLPLVRSLLKNAHNFVDGAKMNGISKLMVLGDTPVTQQLWNAIVIQTGQIKALSITVSTMAITTLGYAVDTLHDGVVRIPKLPTEVLAKSRELMSKIDFNVPKVVKDVQEKSAFAIIRAYSLVNDSLRGEPEKLVAELTSIYNGYPIHFLVVAYFTNLFDFLDCSNTSQPSALLKRSSM